VAESRIALLQELLQAAADPANAEMQRQYHKTPLRFYGVKTEERRRIVRELFGYRPRRPEIEAETRELWRSDYWDEKIVALSLLSAVAHDFTPRDLPWLHELSRGCDGWALLDTLALEVLGPLALVWGEEVYPTLARWSPDEWLWTRRAAILLHIVPARKRELAGEFAWPTWEERLPEKDFFIRKALGWALREASKHYPREVCEFLLRVGDRASPLTRREGARCLPGPLKAKLLG
jgi:3-methyladenine DNA glycosylase AlkD